MRTNKLPEYFEQLNISGLIEGEVAYTVPWAMWADADGNLWIHGGYSIAFEPGGTCHLRICREGKHILVFADSIQDHRYTRGGASYVGDVVALPVLLVK